MFERDVPRRYLYPIIQTYTKLIVKVRGSVSKPYKLCVLRSIIRIQFYTSTSEVLLTDYLQLLRMIVCTC